MRGMTVRALAAAHAAFRHLRSHPEELNDDVLDEFGTWVLGADDAIETAKRYFIDTAA